MYPINPQRRMQDGIWNDSSNGGVSAYISAASSFHPGGCNFGFVDGSVRFIKDTINSWPLDPQSGQPRGLSIDGSSGLYVMAPGTRFGVYQALSTRAGGEVISADNY
jgi:prepilin-type processing-associated H-X9-DG protein